MEPAVGLEGSGVAEVPVVGGEDNPVLLVAALPVLEPVAPLPPLAVLDTAVARLPVVGGGELVAAVPVLDPIVPLAPPAAEAEILYVLVLDTSSKEGEVSSEGEGDVMP